MMDIVNIVAKLVVAFFVLITMVTPGAALHKKIGGHSPRFMTEYPAISFLVLGIILILIGHNL